jgi:hypothetical protein
MTHSARSLAGLLRDGLQTLEYRKHESAAPEDPDYLLLAQHPDHARPQTHAQPPAPSHGSRATNANPTHEEVLNYLGQLAKDYRLPEKLVYAVADAESSFRPKLENHNPPVRDKKGRVVHPGSTDYGLMQINDRTWIGQTVKDLNHRPFKVGQDVKTNWKANAHAGVAILARQYQLADLEQGAGATDEDRAQQAYSGYGHGERNRDLYLQQGGDGQPKYGKDRNFLLKYRRLPERK